MNVRDFDFDLPPGLIAQEPPAERGTSRLLFLHKDSGHLAHTRVTELPGILRAGDVLVVNNTRVFPARLLGRRASGGAVECMLLRRLDARDADYGENRWEALMHPGQKLKPGARVVFDDAGGSAALQLHGEVLGRRFYGRRTIRLWTESGAPVDEVIDAIGHVPLPPYIKREDRRDDRERYQTLFAHERGSVAAPTAGLHFTPALAAALEAGGVTIAQVTLHVGYGTFQPVRVDRVEDHTLDAERYEIGPAAAAAINSALDEGRRVIAVGTTSTRTIEASGLAHRGRVAAESGATDLFIYPGFSFRIISGLLTNFHMPQSSLLMLAAAFAGRERILAAYKTAVEQQYRFYSYGDGMLIL